MLLFQRSGRRPQTNQPRAVSALTIRNNNNDNKDRHHSPMINTYGSRWCVVSPPFHIGARVERKLWGGCTGLIFIFIIIFLRVLPLASLLSLFRSPSGKNDNNNNDRRRDVINHQRRRPSPSHDRKSAPIVVLHNDWSFSAAGGGEANKLTARRAQVQFSRLCVYVHEDGIEDRRGGGCGSHFSAPAAMLLYVLR